MSSAYSDFWNAKWDNNQIGFHSNTVHNLLESYWHRVNPPKDAWVLVPLCGKSLDMLWLIEQGYNVMGIELSQKAIDDFVTENDLINHSTTPVHRIQGGYASDRLRLIVSDFFEFNPKVLDDQAIDAVYDRAALVALSPEWRQRYVKTLKAITPKDTPMLLIGLSYTQDEILTTRTPPPYSISESEIIDYYQSNQPETIQRLARQAVHDLPFNNCQETAYAIQLNPTAQG